jgi:hypothetical protein
LVLFLSGRDDFERAVRERGLKLQRLVRWRRHPLLDLGTITARIRIRTTISGSRNKLSKFSDGLGIRALLSPGIYRSPQTGISREP